LLKLMIFTIALYLFHHCVLNRISKSS
jgi:hypothetical protein